MEKIAHILTTHLIRKNLIATEKKCIYEYGFQVGLEVCLNTFISILISVICDMEMEAIVFFVVFVVLRSYAGGLHLKTYISCLICSCSSLFVLLLIVRYIDVEMIYSVVTECISLFLIRVLAPVQDTNRLLNQEEISWFSKKLNAAIVKILVVSIVFYLLQLKKMLQMISVTTIFMVGILIFGKINYKKAVGMIISQK